MLPRCQDRVTYGRSIRESASRLLDFYGAGAERAALAARDAGTALEERAFWEAVAARVARLHAAPVLTATA